MVVGSLRQETDVAIIGAGPGGYVAALRAADLGLDVLLIEERSRPGGVCLLEGCIPSKTLIHAVDLIKSAREAKDIGLTFGEVKIDRDRLLGFTNQVMSDLSGGIERLLKARGVELIRGRARFSSDHSLEIEGGDTAGVDFKHAIIATGSRINEVPTFYDVPVWSSADALKLPEIPKRLLVVGGGYIGLEMGLVYAGLGSQVTVVEFNPRLLYGADPDLVQVMVKNCAQSFHGILVDSKVVKVEKSSVGFVVDIEHDGSTSRSEYEQVLVAVGRKPNTDRMGLEELGIKTEGNPFLSVTPEGRTKIPHIFAIGDVTPGPMLAHKASREGRVVAEVISGQSSAFDNRAIPAVVFTDPEIAWTGLTETEAAQEKLPVNVGRFPLSALGRARTLGRTEGFVKIISAPDTQLILGVGIVAPQASELIAEGTLAIEMGATLEDLMNTIHPHPTLSEALMEAAEVAAGASVHVTRKKS